MKNISYLFRKNLPYLLVCAFLLVPVPVYAGWLGDVFDVAVGAVQVYVNVVTAGVRVLAKCAGIVGEGSCSDAILDEVANLLGIDTNIQCTPPRAVGKCMFCPMFEIIFNAGAAVAAAGYAAFGSSLGQIVLAFLAVSLALIILKNVASMGAKETGPMMNELFTRAFVCVAVYIIMTRDYYNVMNMTIAPIISDGLGLVGMGNGAAVGSVAGSGGGAGAGGVMPRSIGISVVNAVRDIEAKIDTLFEYGKYAFCLGMGPERIWKIIPNPIYLVDGAILYLAGILFLVVYPWILADAVIQLGIALALLPFAVAGYPFSITKGYLSKTLDMILNSIFVFLFTAIVLNTVLGYIGLFLGAVLDGGGDPAVLFTDPNAGLAFYGPNMLRLIFILAIGWMYLPLAKEIAGEFAKGAPLNAAGKIGTTLAEQADKQMGKAANWAADKAGHAAVSAVSTGANNVSRWTRAGARRAAVQMTKTFGHVDGDGNMTFNVGGRLARNPVGRYLTRGLSFTVERDGEGRAILRREFTSITGRRHVMHSDKYSTIKEEYDRHGNRISQHTRFKHNFLRKHLMNEDGTLNMGAYNKLMNSAMGQEYKKELTEALAKTILEKRMGKKACSNYFKSREVTFDPDNPYKISINQVDYAGKTTTFVMDINAATGQVATSMEQERTNVKAPSAKDLAKASRKMAKIASILGGAMKKKGLFFTYEQRTDSSGNIVYTKNLRAFWNIKNYYRTVKNPVKYALKTAVSTADLALTTGLTIVKAPIRAAKLIVDVPLELGGFALMHPMRSARGEIFSHLGKVMKEDLKSIAGDGDITKKLKNFKKDWHDSFDGTWQTGNIHQYSATAGHTEINSKNGQPADNRKTEKTVFFDNGAVQMTSHGTFDSNGTCINETTKYNYSEQVQKNHDSIGSVDDHYQAVRRDGTIAPDLGPTRGGNPNPFDLTFGMGDMAGVTSINGQSTTDFFVNNILAEGSRRNTNHLRTSMLQFF